MRFLAEKKGKSPELCKSNIEASDDEESPKKREFPRAFHRLAALPDLL